MSTRAPGSGPDYSHDVVGLSADHQGSLLDVASAPCRLTRALRLGPRGGVVLDVNWAHITSIGSRPWHGP